MGILSGYLRFQIVVITAVVLAIGAVGVLTSSNGLGGLLSLFGIVILGFAALFVVLRLR